MDLSLAGTHVFLAMPVHRDLPVETVKSLLQTQAEMQRRNLDMSLDLQSGGSCVFHARSASAVYFLRSPCTHLFFIDSDIVWEADDFVRFLALATKMECVCASYPRKQDEVEFFIDFIDKTAVANEYGCIPIKGAGLGFTVVQRKVIEELAAKAPKLRCGTNGKPVPRIFRFDDVDGEERTEDHAFFSDIRDLGYKVHIDPTITLGHVGTKVYRASAMECLSKA